MRRHLSHTHRFLSLLLVLAAAPLWLGYLEWTLVIPIIPLFLADAPYDLAPQPPGIASLCILRHDRPLNHSSSDSCVGRSPQVRLSPIFFELWLLICTLGSHGCEKLASLLLVRPGNRSKLGCLYPCVTEVLAAGHDVNLNSHSNFSHQYIKLPSPWARTSSISFWPR